MVLNNIYNGQWQQHQLNPRAEYWLIRLKLQQMTGQLGLLPFPESDNGHRCSLGEWQNHRGIPILQGPAPMMMNQIEAGQ